MDSDKKIHKFSALDSQSQYMILKNLFEKLKDKNKNCAYIYEKMLSEPLLFTAETNQIIYQEALDIWDRINGEKRSIGEAKLEQSRKLLEEIRKKELIDMDESPDDLLAFI